MANQSMEKGESTQGGQLTSAVDREESTHKAEGESLKLFTGLKKKAEHPW